MSKNHNNQPVVGIPDTSKAEKWLSADVFLFKGRLWKLCLNGRIVPVKRKDRLEVFN